MGVRQVPASIALAARCLPALGLRDMATVATGVVAPNLAVDQRATRRRAVIEFFQHEHARIFRHDKALPIRVDVAAPRGCHSIATGLVSLAKPLIPMGVMAASEPPVIMTSASSCWIALKASPIALRCAGGARMTTT